MRNKQRIRFKGFTEDWEQRKLIDIAKTFIGLVTTMTENYRDSGTLLIRNSDIKEGQFVFSENPIHLDEEFAEKNKTRKLQIGDVVTVHTGDIGTSAVIEEKEAGAIGFATINTRTDKSILNPYFLATYFNTEKHKCYANSVSTGDGRSNYNIKDFNKLVISIPTLDEQERISLLINNINTIITLHQRKLEKLKLAKKALLQKLFLKNGSQFPEIRFKGFTDAWEQRKLGDIATITGGGTPSTNISEYWNGDIDWYSPVEIGEKRYASGSIRKITKLGLEKSSAKILPVGTVLFTSRAGIGNTAILQVEGCTNQGFQSITPNSKELDTYFLYTMTPKLKRYGEVTGAGSTFVEVSGKQMEQMNLMIPSLDEQKHVSQLFKVMDDTITLHQRKLDKLQEVKKGLLQKMFV